VLGETIKSESSSNQRTRRTLTHIKEVVGGVVGGRMVWEIWEIWKIVSVKNTCAIAACLNGP